MTRSIQTLLFALVLKAFAVTALAEERIALPTLEVRAPVPEVSSHRLRAEAAQAISAFLRSDLDSLQTRLRLDLDRQRLVDALSWQRPPVPGHEALVAESDTEAAPAAVAGSVGAEVTPRVSGRSWQRLLPGSIK